MEEPKRPDGPYRITPAYMPDRCLIPGEVGQEVKVRACKDTQPEERGWIVDKDSGFSKIYHPNTKSCLKPTKPDEIITVSCRQGEHDYRIWKVHYLPGDLVMIAFDDKCLSTNGSDVMLMSCDLRIGTTLWKLIENEKPIPTADIGGAAKMKMECPGANPGRIPAMMCDDIRDWGYYRIACGCTEEETGRYWDEVISRVYLEGEKP